MKNEFYKRKIIKNANISTCQKISYFMLLFAFFCLAILSLNCKNINFLSKNTNLYQKNSTVLANSTSKPSLSIFVDDNKICWETLGFDQNENFIYKISFNDVFYGNTSDNFLLFSDFLPIFQNLKSTIKITVEIVKNDPINGNVSICKNSSFFNAEQNIKTPKNASIARIDDKIYLSFTQYPFDTTIYFENIKNLSNYTNPQVILNSMKKEIGNFAEISDVLNSGENKIVFFVSNNFGHFSNPILISCIGDEK